MPSIIALAESGWVPDSLVRLGIRAIVRERLRDERRAPPGTKAARTQGLKASTIALHTDAANTQHYELPTSFFEQVLGPRLKYSASIYPDATTSLADAEIHTLEMYAEHLGISDGDRVLDLGCGWGSFALWMAARNPTVRITAVSNSSVQRRYIEARAAEERLTNLEVLTADINELALPEASFDKVISVEMFEHIRNYQAVLARISRWLSSEGQLFVHIFCHKDLLYPYEPVGETNWMARYFFTGGQMPAADTLSAFQDDLRLQQTWHYDGTHYQRTARHWLENMDERIDAVAPPLRDTYGEQHWRTWRQRWRMFFMAVEEMFGHAGGREWQVSHYLFCKPC